MYGLFSANDFLFVMKCPSKPRSIPPQPENKDRTLCFLPFCRGSSSNRIGIIDSSALSDCTFKLANSCSLFKESSSLISFHGNKSPCVYGEAQGRSCFDISDWKRCRIKHNESPTLFVRGHYRFCFCVVLVFQFYVTRSEMNLVLFVSYSLLPCSFLFVLTNTQSHINLNSCDYYIQKEWVLYICLSHPSRPTTALQKEGCSILAAHYGEYMLHPVELPCICLGSANRLW